MYMMWSLVGIPLWPIQETDLIESRHFLDSVLMLCYCRPVHLVSLLNVQPLIPGSGSFVLFSFLVLFSLRNRSIYVRNDGRGMLRKTELLIWPLYKGTRIHSTA